MKKYIAAAGTLALLAYGVVTAVQLMAAMGQYEGSGYFHE